MRTLLLAAVLFAVPADAKEWLPRTDLEVVALDAKTGALKWSHQGTPLANAHFELYADVLAVYPHYDLTDKSNPIFLDPKTGAAAPDTRDPAKLRARSSGQWIKESIVLANGWRADGFKAGYTKDVDLVDPKTGQTAWTIRSAQYPEFVRAYKNLAFVGYGYLTDESMLFAYAAGASKPAWSIDFNKLLRKPAAKKAQQRLGRVAYQIIDDVLYAQTGEHVFAITPATGTILWRRDVAASLGVKYEPDLYGGALDVAVFAREGDVLVVSFEKRVAALRADTGRILWSIDPDTFPHSAFPLVANGLVYITAGPKRTEAKLQI
jgi:outer membrane protein assembly factor BamB